MRKKRIIEREVLAISEMCKNITRSVRIDGEKSEEFEVELGVLSFFYSKSGLVSLLKNDSRFVGLQTNPFLLNRLQLATQSLVHSDLI